MTQHVVEVGELFAESRLADQMLLFIDRLQIRRSVVADVVLVRLWSGETRTVLHVGVKIKILFSLGLKDYIRGR